MIDLGKKHDSATCGPVEAKASKEPYYPSLYLDNIDLGLGEDDAGKEFTAIVKIKVRSISSNVSSDGKKSNSVTLDIKGIEFGKGKIKDGREHPLQTAIEEGLEQTAKDKKKDK